MVVGGVANLQWGDPRTTLDLDITVAAEDQTLVGLAQEVGHIIVGDPAAFLAKTRVLPLRLGDGTRIDFIAATVPYELSAIRRARTVDIGGRPCRFCAPEDLVIHKIVSDRPRDHADVRGILRRQAKVIDLEYLDPLVEALSRDLAKPEILERYLETKAAAGLPGILPP